MQQIIEKQQETCEVRILIDKYWITRMFRNLIANHTMFKDY